MPKCQQELPITVWHSEPVCQHNPKFGAEYDGKFYCVFHLPKEAKDNSSWKPGGKQHKNFIGYLNRVIADINSKNAKQGPNTFLDLRSATFPADVSFLDYPQTGQPLPPSDFKNSTFLGDIDFSSVTFQGSINFEGAEFFGMAKFRASNFGAGESANFTGCIMGNASDFSEASFPRRVTFVGAQFRGLAEFVSTRFSAADFSEVHFFGDCAFGSAVFSRSTYFQECFFHPPKDRTAPRNFIADFSNSDFRDTVSFMSANINHAVNFESANFNKGVDFYSTNFNRAPSVLGTNFGADVVFENATFAEGNVATYRKIKKLMEEQGNMWEATLFYGRELSEERKALKGLQKISLNFVFWLLNDYGRKWWLSFVWLIASVFCFALIFYLTDSMVILAQEELDGWEKDISNFDRIWQALLFSAQNLKLSWLIGKPVILAKFGWVWLVSGIQTIINVVLITMTILSIRRRFKIF